MKTSRNEIHGFCRLCRRIQNFANSMFSDQMAATMEFVMPLRPVMNGISCSVTSGIPRRDAILRIQSMWCFRTVGLNLEIRHAATSAEPPSSAIPMDKQTSRSG
jgi:hypothetical protein